jgi:diguanylate cyclase (GGDEF)-like protein
VAVQHIIVSLYKGNHQIETEFTFRKFNNVLTHTIVRLSLVAGAEDDWSRVYVSLLDITERKWTEERLRYLSMHDSMTGLYNRAFFENELGRLSRGRTFPVSIIIGDLDNLKRVNDTYGHKSGDALICQTASILLDTFRGEDIIARLGGDEFAVIIPCLEEIIIQKILVRLQKKIDEYNIEQENPGKKINLSLGTATAEDNFKTEDLFKLADQRMYREKNGKRKKVNEI